MAQSGWIISGYDISGVALRQANAAASAAGSEPDTQLASHDEYELGQSQWDLIVMSFAFTKLASKDVRPREPGMILKVFLEYRVLLFDDLPDVADWGKVKAPLLRVALEKRP